MLELQRYNSQDAIKIAYRALRDKDPQLRAAAILYLETQPPRELINRLTPLLQDPARLVRTEAARVLAGVPISQLTN